MTDLKILFNGQMADIGNSTNFPFAISRQVMDFANATSQGGDHTYTLVFPPTKVNDNIFGTQLAEVGAAKKFRTVQPMTVEVYSGGLRIFRGVPVVKSAGRNQGYAVTLISDNIDWATQLQNKSLRDLATLPDVPFTGYRTYGVPIEPANPVTQEDIWPLLTGLDTIVQFPLVAYGNYPYTGVTLTGIGANQIRELQWVDINPCCFVYPVVKAIVNELGFSLASGFFDSEEAIEFLTAYTGDTPPAWNWGLLARANASNTPYDYRAEIFPPLFNYDFQLFASYFWRLVTATVNWNYSDSYFQTAPPEQYITPTSGVYSFNLSLGNVTLYKGLSGGIVPVTPYNFLRTAIAIVIVPSDPDALLAMQQSLGEYISDQTIAVVSDQNIIAFYDFGTGYQESPYTLLPFTVGGTYSQSVTGIPGTPGAKLDGLGTVNILITDVSLSQGTRVEFWLISQYGVVDPVENQTFTADAYTIDISETSFSNELELAPLLPDITQYDYLKSLVSDFNLRFSVDVERRIMRFDTWDNFFRNNQLAREWTALGSDSNTPSKPVPFYQKSILRYSNDDNDALLNQFGVSQFQQTITNNSIYAIRSTEEIEVSSFSPTYEREYIFRLLHGATPSNRVIIPCMASDSQLEVSQSDIVWDYNYKPRLLKYIGLQAGSWNYHGNTLVAYPAARFSFAETGGVSLAFGENAGRLVRQSGVIVSPTQNEGLYKRFWKKFFELRPNTHIQEVVVSLNAQEFAQADPSLPILFHGIYYWVYGYLEPFDPITQGPIRIELLRQV